MYEIYFYTLTINVIELISGMEFSYLVISTLNSPKKIFKPFFTKSSNFFKPEKPLPESVFIVKLRGKNINHTSLNNNQL